MALVLSKDFPGASPDSVDGETIRELMRTALWNAQAAGRPSSALVVANESAGRIERRHGPDAVERTRLWLADRILAWARAEGENRELLAHADDERLILLLPGARPEDAKSLARELIEDSRGDGIDVGGERETLRLSAGVADGARPGRPHLETLLEVAREGSLVAGGGGGNRCVHTELYDMLQARFERELPLSALRPPELVAAPTPPPPAATVGMAPDSEEEDQDAEVLSILDEDELEIPRRPTIDLELPGIVEEALTAELTELSGPRITHTQRDLVDLALLRARQAWRQAAEEVLDRHTLEIDRLERRIGKLKSALRSAERSLRERAELAEVDEGVASAFRDVQGLSVEEENYAIKRELMGMIFEANLALRDKLRGA